MNAYSSLEKLKANNYQDLDLLLAKNNILNRKIILETLLKDSNEQYEQLVYWYFNDPVYWRPVINIMIDRNMLKLNFIRNIVRLIADILFYHYTLLYTPLADTMAREFEDEYPELERIIRLSRTRLVKYWSWLCSQPGTSSYILEIFRERDRMKLAKYEIQFKSYVNYYSNIRLLVELREVDYLNSIKFGKRLCKIRNDSYQKETVDGNFSIFWNQKQYEYLLNYL